MSEGGPSRSLSPADVAARLAVLRQIAVTERDEEARARLAKERPTPQETFEAAVHRRLRELHALCALAGYVHRAVPGGPSQTNAREDPAR